MSIEIAHRWLKERARSTNERDHDAYLELISKHFQAFIPNQRKSIGYTDWVRNYLYELRTQTDYAVVSYGATRLKANLPGRVMFETVEANRESLRKIEVIIQQEEDGKWRALQEKVGPAVHTKTPQAAEPLRQQA